MDLLSLKQQAAEFAVGMVRSGMVVGLGHGSTAIFAVRELAALLRAGALTGITGIPCSTTVESEAHALGIPLTSLEENAIIDLTIDGADEVALDSFTVIKGGGGALLREKIVAQASRREIIVVDDSKLSPALGTRHAVPVEVATFGWGAQARFLEHLGASIHLRQDDHGEPFLSDQGNLILDCDFGPIADPAALAARLDARAGILEHGLFIALVTDIVIADERGVRHLRR
ncbi:MAG: Ribose-5-phosphate isomerase A [bacterium ADurb.Bin429]|nr:MAG: Ribose-5-phosphate isomerase A [bacterium ADurb.Bin429]